MPSIKTALQFMIDIANDDTHGYDQTNRYGPDYDCSSLVAIALNNAGFNVARDSWTGNLESQLRNCGFTDCTAPWKAGDIHLKIGKHVATSVNSTQIVHATKNEKGTVTGGVTGDQTGEEICIASYFEYSGGWDVHLRYGDSDIITTSIYVVSAICGNFWQESTLSPGVWQNLTPALPTDLRKGYGLGQWTNVNGDTHGRLYQLTSWLSENGYDQDDGDGQLAFLLYENLWIPHADYTFQTLTEFLQSDSTDIEMLTHAFNQCWEGIHDSSWDLRVEFANKCYNYIQQHYDDKSITQWYTENIYLPESNSLNNAVMAYRYLTDATPPTPVKRKKKMPVWMKIRYHY